MTNLTAAVRLSNLRGSCLGLICLAQRRGLCTGHGGGIGHFEISLGRGLLGCFRRCGAKQLRTRVHDPLPLARRGLAFLGSGDTLLRGAMMNRLLRRRDLIGDLEPAFALAIETIDLVLAVGRLAGTRHALLFGRGGRWGFRGSGIEQEVKGIRRCRRRRETCEKDTSCEARSQMTGHRDPGVAPPLGRLP